MRKILLVLALITIVVTPCFAADIPAPTGSLSVEECERVTRAITSRLRDPTLPK
jgi:hypothetical protein